MTITRNGPTTEGTKSNLVGGVRSSAMQRSAVDGALDQAVEFVQRLVDVYSSQIADGEVGQGGSAQASDNPILANRAPRALLYGRVQSGKTAAMILTAALCLDNGFRVVVVLTTDNVALVRQTVNRFKDLDGPRVFSGLKEGPSYEWEGQEVELRASAANEGLVLVCSKNAFNLPEVIQLLFQIDASTLPVLVLDDEADAATPDTTLAARSSARPNAPEYASRMHRLVISNDRPDELGFSLGELLPHSLYVQVTATPYVLILQRESAQLRPTMTFLLEPGEGYCGGEVFFGGFDPTLPDIRQPTPLVIIQANEGAAMRRAAPIGFADSLNYFIISACACGTETSWPVRGYKHLSHTSHRTDEHEVVAGHIAEHLNQIRGVIRQGGESIANFFSIAYQELSRSVNSLRPLEDIIPSIRSAMQNAEIYRVNSKSDAPDYGPRLNFIVGGNILGRGLTIDYLLVTYYIREAKTSQMDTVWQHARMFGYRRPYLNYIRVYLPQQLAMRFKQIHEAEEALRLALVSETGADAILIRLPNASRATRPNALDVGAVRTVASGRDQIFPHRLPLMPSPARAVMDVLLDASVPVNEDNRDERPTSVRFDSALLLIEKVVVEEEDPGLWDAALIRALLQSYKDHYAAGVVVYVRQVEGLPPAEGWWRGRLGGPEIALLRQRSPNAPALALLYSGNHESPVGWYPTLVMPPDSPTFVFSEE